MRQMSFTPSVVRRLTVRSTSCWNDFGNLGRSYRETDVDDCDRASVVNDLLQGQFHNPVRVIAFNAQKGGRPTRRRKSREPFWSAHAPRARPYPARSRRFCERHTIEYLQADLFAA